MSKLKMRTTQGRFARYGRRWRLAQREGRRGTAMVEFSLAAPVLFVVLFGIIEFALAIHTEIDFSNGVSAMVRSATVIGANNLTDDQIGSSIFDTIRQDDPDRLNYYRITAVKSHWLDATANLYQSTYAYDHSQKSWDENAYDGVLYLQTKYGGTAPTACQYYYEAHKVTTSSGTFVYLDRSEKIQINPTPTAGADNDNDGDADNDPTVHYPHGATDLAAGGLLDGCGRSYDKTTATPGKYDTTNWVCNAGSTGTTASFLGHAGNLCYYYPDERTNTIDATKSGDNILPDLIEVGVDYTYKPLGDYVTAHSPLGVGFEITEHARGRIEPTATSG